MGSASLEGFHDHRVSVSPKGVALNRRIRALDSGFWILDPAARKSRL